MTFEARDASRLAVSLRNVAMNLPRRYARHSDARATVPPGRRESCDGHHLLLLCCPCVGTPETKTRIFDFKSKESFPQGPILIVEQSPGSSGCGTPSG